MQRARVIPCLLLRDGGLVKTVKFASPRYVGDPINAVRIFNDKEVDELAFLDISATPAGRGPNFALLSDIAGEAFMPFSYGGGITRLEEVRQLFALGIERVILNSIVGTKPELIAEAAEIAGSSSVVVSMDVKRSWLGSYTVCTRSGSLDIKRDPVEFARDAERLGAGEILLNAIDRDGTMQGYDLDLLHRITTSVSIPVVVIGGAGQLEHFREALRHGASAVAAGSMFVFHGKHRAVLMTYPEYSQLEQLIL